MLIITTISVFVTAIATAIIAKYSHETHKLNLEILKVNKENQEETRDLYQAIVVATILSGPTSVGSFEEARRSFLKVYTGKTKIF